MYCGSKKTFTIFICLWVFFTTVKESHGQIITTFAGTGAVGNSGDGGLATAAKLGFPYGVVIDNAGSLLIVLSDQNIIRKVDVNGIITTFAGTGTLGYTGDGGLATAARLYHPQYISADKLGNIYVTDQNSAIVRKINSAGIISTITGNATATAYTGDGGPATLAYWGTIRSVTPDNQGNLYLSDDYYNVIRKINSAGIVTRFAGVPTGGGGGSFSGDGGQAINATFFRPFALDIDNAGNIYVADTHNHRIRKITTSGIITTIAGTGVAGSFGNGGNALSAQLDLPTCIRVDLNGMLYIDDYGNNSIRKVDAAGIISAFAGNNTAGYSGDGGLAISAQLSSPENIALDNSGNIYISDYYNFVIRKVNNCVPAAVVTGNSNICMGTSTPLSNATAGGTWSSSDPTIATITANGTVSGIKDGTTVINYTVTSGTCTVQSSFNMTISKMPVVPSITGNANLCQTEIVQLTNTEPLGLWSSDNAGVASVDNTGKITGNSPGTATISYRVTNTCGSNANARLITVKQTPVVSALAGPGTICVGANTILTTATPNGQWSSNDLSVVTVDANGTIKGISAGTGFIRYSVTTSGCTNSVGLTVTVAAVPVVNTIQGNSFVCLNSLAQVNNPTPGGSWVSNDTNILTIDQNGKITGKSTGKATIQYTVPSQYCGSASASSIIDVYPLPNVAFNLPSICMPDGNGKFVDLSTISDGSSSLFSYLWDFGDRANPVASTLPDPVHRYPSVGSYNVKLLVTSKYGCQSSLTQQLTTIYPQPKAFFDMSADTICLDNSIAFTDKSSTLSSVNSWHWNFGRGDSLFINNPVYKFTDSGPFQISLYIIDSKGCISDTVTKGVQVYPYPKLTMENVQGVLEGGTIIIKPKDYYGTSLHFLWTPSIYLDSTTIVAPHTSPLNDITYTLTLTGIGGCAVTENMFISVLKTPVIPNVFSPNGDGVNDTWKIPYLNSYTDAEIKIFNRNGEVIWSSVGYMKEWDGAVNGHIVPVATYYYVINPKNGRSIMTGSVTIIK